MPQKANRYEAIMVVSQRARQLIDGAEPVMETKARKPVTIALEELEAGKIEWEYE
ncbi:MAG: DNA-directed RNA polymerase subunit omega [Limnochordia bacterium]|jgi:DNA-directed RNA polymerase subunit omega|nr:DNA-directed RNA polymerase subunit omega [Bacillota bacterium]NLL09272.1 DNA-directed RNA polymerase subunit omega [Bacillota bacterium]HBG09898.1 DNA-directed RNA polymerase subunit omega [Bacillota bacterium]